jgi:DTW domain-containing protein YfiP
MVLHVVAVMKSAWGLSIGDKPTALFVERDAHYDWHKINGSILKGERRALDRATALREACKGCHRPHSLCLCEDLPQPQTLHNTHVLILQHPNERRKRNLSTTPLLQLALKNVSVKVGYEFDESALEPYQNLQPLLLYPSEDAIVLSSDEDLRHETSQLLPNHEHLLLILVDGTWNEAKRILRESPRLVDQCRTVCFRDVNEISMYDVLRKEPQSHCLSTLEACGKALQYLEKDRANHLQETLHQLLRAHVKAHLVNKRKMEQQPRYVNRGGGKHIKTRQELIEERMAIQQYCHGA